MLFDNIIVDANPVTPIADKWGETRNNCAPFQYGSFGVTQKSAACDRLTYAWTLYGKEYVVRLQEFKDGPLSLDIINEKLDKWTAQIREATLESEKSFDDGLTLERWQQGILTLKSNLTVARL